MRGSLGLLIARNWPIKLAAVFFAIMLYIAVAAQQPLTQTFSLQLAVAVPPGRSLREQPPGVTVVIAGKGSEIIKLRSFPRVVRKTIPDTFSASVWRVHLQPSDVELPKGTDVQVAENVQCRKIVRLVLDQLAVFLHGRRNLPHFEVSLGGTQSLFLIERHVLRSNGMNSGERSNALL